MSTLPPKNIKPVQHSQMTSRTWAYIPFLWEVAGLKRHSTWTFNSSDLPEDWPLWVAEYKEYFMTKGINIRQQLEKSETLASIPFATKNRIHATTTWWRPSRAQPQQMDNRDHATRLVSPIRSNTSAAKFPRTPTHDPPRHHRRYQEQIDSKQHTNYRTTSESQVD